MLRRPPTRIEISVEDAEEWEQVQKERGIGRSSNPLINAKSKQSVEERIGLKQSGPKSNIYSSSS